MDEMPKGFGTFQSGVEIDSLYAKMEAGVNIPNSNKMGMADEEFRRIQEREDNMDLAANSVIRKFNTNSERILNLLVKPTAKQNKSDKAKDYLTETMDRNDRQQMEQKQASNQLLSAIAMNDESLY